MWNCFISYSSKDETLATYTKKILESNGLEVFLASQNIKVGDKWSEKIKQAFNSAEYVIVIVTENSINSSFVNQKFGGALFTNKRIVIISVGISPERLPGWMKEYQSLIINNNTTITQLNNNLTKVANNIKGNKNRTRAVVGLAVFGLLALSGD